jgi:hypothetical protein
MGVAVHHADEVAIIVVHAPLDAHVLKRIKRVNPSRCRHVRAGMEFRRHVERRTRGGDQPAGFERILPNCKINDPVEGRSAELEHGRNVSCRQPSCRPNRAERLHGEHLMSTTLGMDFGSHRSGAGRIPAEQLCEYRFDHTPRCLTS